MQMLIFVMQTTPPRLSVYDGTYQATITGVQRLRRLLWWQQADMTAWKEDEEASSWSEVMMDRGCANERLDCHREGCGQEERGGTLDIFGVLLYFFHSCFCDASFSL